MNGQRRLLGSFNHGSMANALPQAIGAQAALPDRQVVTLSGDGGLAMLLGDLLTLRQPNLPVKMVVFNNSALGFVELEMKAAGRIAFGTDLVNPNFAKLAQSAGMLGIRVEDPAEAAAGIREGLGPCRAGAGRRGGQPPRAVDAAHDHGRAGPRLQSVCAAGRSSADEVTKSSIWRKQIFLHGDGVPVMKSKEALCAVFEADRIEVPLTGQMLVERPLLNKGTAFSPSEREELGLLGLLPPHEETLDDQAARAFEAYQAKPTDLERHIYLRAAAGHERDIVLPRAARSPG